MEGYIIARLYSLSHYFNRFLGNIPIMDFRGTTSFEAFVNNPAFKFKAPEQKKHLVEVEFPVKRMTTTLEL